MSAEMSMEMPERSVDLVALLKGRLLARQKERTREAMPSMDIELRDGTVLTVTLKRHHWGSE